MKKIFCILHDSYSNNKEPWIVTVADQLRARGNTVYTPNLPTPVGQEYLSWKVLASNELSLLEKTSIMITVGASCAFFLRFLSENPAVSIGKLILLAPFVTPVSNPSEQFAVSSFILAQYPWDQIRNQVTEILVYSSSNDTTVSAEQSKFIATSLTAQYTILDGRGHFRAIDSIRDLPEITLIADTEIREQSSISIIDNKKDIPKPQRAPSKELSIENFENIISNNPIEIKERVQEERQDQIEIPLPIPTLAEQSTSPSEEFISYQTQEITSTGEPTEPPLSGPVMHSLARDFSSALAQAAPGEVAKTLENYRLGEEVESEKRSVSKIQILLTLLTIIMLGTGIYLAYRGYIQNKNIPIINQPIITPIKTTENKNLAIDTERNQGELLKIIRTTLEEADISSGSIATINLTDTSEQKNPLSTSALFRLLAGDKLEILQRDMHTPVIGSIKHDLGYNSFIFAESKKANESVIITEMKSWEPSIPKDLLELFHPSLELDTTKILLESETRMVNNRMLHVIKATPKEEDEEFIITDEEITSSRDVEKIEAPKEEKPEIPLQITIVSEENMSEIQKTERSVMIKKDSKFLKNKELKLGDILIFNYKESSEKDSKNEEDIILETKELMQPASIFKITDFSQTDNRFEYKTKEIPIKNISELITNAGKTIPSDMSTSELLLNPNKSLSTNITEPTDLFVYTVINERLLIITKDIEDIETVLTAYKANNQ